jgi:hypothetical protein
MPGVRFILKPAALSRRRTQPVLVKVLMVEPGQPGVPVRRTVRRSTCRGFRRGETVEKPGVDLRIELRQLLQRIADQQRQGHPAIGQVRRWKP